MSNPDIEQLRARVSGGVITPSDDGYDEARHVYNAMIDRRPAVIVRCGNAADVRAAVDFARENGLALAVRGGGHSVPGFGTVDDGVVADLSGMRAVTVDPAKRTARGARSAPLAPRVGRPGATSTRRRPPSVSRPPAGSSPPQESPG